MDLLDQIRYEGEHTGFDFKAITYARDKSEDLLKDIMAMANAELTTDRFIVVGVKHHPNGNRDILGVEEFIDDASYYQLVHSNIEPDIHFEFFYLPIDDKKVGVFRIFNCDDPPYMVRKDGKTLRKRDSYIRKGTSQTKLMRADIDRIFARRQAAPDLAAKVEAVCEIDGKPGASSMTPEVETGLPSTNAARRIRRVIADKEMTEAEREARKQAMGDKKEANPLFSGFLDSPVFAQMNAAAAIASGRGLPYESRDLTTLKDNLGAVKETYRDDDLYYTYEERARKINFLLSNHGEEYIEDCTVEIQLNKSFPFVVAPTVYRKPEHRSSFIPSLAIHGSSYEVMHYPKVTENSECYIIKAHIGDLRHHLSTPALKVPARVTLPMNSVGQQLKVTLTLFGKNLPKPYIKSLFIDVI